MLKNGQNIQVYNWLVQVICKNPLSKTILDKIFKKNFGFQIKKRTTAKLQYLVLTNFLLVLEKFLF